MIMFHKEGKTIISLTAAILVFLVILLLRFSGLNKVTGIAGVVFVVFFALILNFFRNPKRRAPKEEHLVVAPADGKVVVVEDVTESEYFKDKRKQISIFMSPLDVHVNRCPVEGTVKYIKYHPGRYLVAWHPKSSLENEHNTVVIAHKKTDILFRQIAGAMAKRIKCYIKEGETVEKGQEMGFIRFGSRLDILLPPTASVKVDLNRYVKGGETVIAEI